TTQRSNVDNVRTGGIHDAPPDLLRRLEPHQLPGSATVGRLVNSTTGRDRVPRILFAGSRVNDVRVRWSQGDITHRDHFFLVEQRKEHRSGVDRFPNATGRRGDVEDFRISGDA